MSLEWLLEDIFTNLDRGFLLERQSRQQMVDYFDTIVEAFRLKNAHSDGQLECELVVHATIEFHEKSKGGNNGVCLFGKYHDILHVAAKLCHLRNVQNTTTVCTLLARIYECEYTFEKFFECAILGTKVTQLISGWRSYYRTQEENIDACFYFLEHATKGGLTFDCKLKRCNYIDVPMNCYEKLSPLKMAVKAEKWDLANTFMRYGALTHVSADDDDNYEKYSLMRLYVRKLENSKYEFEECRMNTILESFKTYVRSVPSIHSIGQFEAVVDTDTSIVFCVFLKEFGIEDVDEPRTLKHLARCAVRNGLRENHQLPARARDLNLPLVLEKYLNLETD